MKAEPLPEERRLESPVPQTSITRKEIESQPNRHIGDAIKRMPGVYMGGPPGENNDLRLRGLDKEFTRVQVDGFQIPDGGEKRELQLNRIPSYLIEEATIIRNPTAEYESDGLAGKVDLKTRPIPRKFSGEARFGYGGRRKLEDTVWNGSLSLGGRPAPWFGLLGSFNYNDDPLLKLKTEREFRANGNLKKDTSENEEKALSSTDTFFDLGLFYDGGELHVKPLLLRQIEDRTKVKLAKDLTKTAATDDTRENEQEEKLRQTVGTALDHRHQFQNGVKLENQMAYYSTAESKKNKTKDSFNEAGGFLKFDKREVESEDKEDETWNLANKIAIPLDLGVPNELKLGTSFRFRSRFRDKTLKEIKANGMVSDKTKPKDTYFLEEDYFAAFAQDEAWVTDRLSILPGVRAERVELSSRDRTSADATRGMTDINPSLHTLYRATDQLSLKAAISRAVNRPKFDELSPFEQDDGTKITIGNPNLDPARSWNVDAGFDYAIRDLFSGVNVFHKDVSGVIEEENTGIIRSGKQVFQVQNVGDGNVQGVELEQRVGFQWTEVSALAGLELWANETLLESRLRDKQGAVRPFKEQPEVIANTGLTYRLDRLGAVLTFSARHVGDRDWVEANDDHKSLEAEWTFDVALHQRLHENLHAFVEVENLTDEGRVETTLRANGERVHKVESVGKTFLIGLTYQF